MRILALDLSLTATGWARSLTDHGVETNPGKLRGVERLDAWADWLAYDALEPGTPNLDVVVLEGYAFGRPNSMAAIAEWGGVARLEIYRAGQVFVEIPPATLKKFATGRGNAKKPDMRMELFKRTNLDVADDNEVDALWLLAAAREAAGDPLWEMPKANCEALRSVEWPAVRRG